MVQGRVVRIRMQSQAQLRHRADRVIERPALPAQSAQVVGIGRHHGKYQAPLGVAARQFGIVDDGVAMVDAIDVQFVDGGGHVHPRHAEFARVRGALEAGLARGAVGLQKQFGRSIVFAVVDADADHLRRAVRLHPFHHLHGFLWRCFAVDAGDQAADHAKIALGVADRRHDGVLRRLIADARHAHGAGRVPEKLGIHHAVAVRVLQVFIRQTIQVGRRHNQVRIERAQHAQHAHRFLATRIERVDLFRRDDVVRLGGQVAESGLAHRAEQMAMQLHLRDGADKLFDAQSGMGHESFRVKAKGRRNGVRRGWPTAVASGVQSRPGRRPGAPPGW